MENKFSKLNKRTQSSKLPFALFSLVLSIYFIFPNTSKAGFTDLLPKSVTSTLKSIPGAEAYVTNLVNTPGATSKIATTLQAINDSAKGYLDLGKSIVNNPLISKTVNAIDPGAIDKINGLSKTLDANGKTLTDTQGKLKQLDAAIAYCGGADNLNTQCAAKAIGDVMGAIGDIKALTGSGDMSQKLQAAQNLFSRLSALDPGLKGVSDMLGTAGSLFSGGGSIADKAMGFAQSAMSSTNGANLLGAGGSLGDLAKGVNADVPNLTGTPEGRDFFSKTQGTALSGAKPQAVETKSTVCGGEGGPSSGGDNGVPVVEQTGPLLTATKQTASLTKDNCNFLKITSEMVTDIDKIQNWMKTKLEKGDPDQWKISKKATEKAAEDFEKDLKTKGRDRSDDHKGDPKESAAPDLKTLEREEKTAARLGLLSDVKEITKSVSSSYAKENAEAIKKILETTNDTLSEQKGASALFIAQNTPTLDFEPDSLSTVKNRVEYFDKILKLRDPVNTRYGMMLNYSLEMDKRQTENANAAEQELAMGQGLIGKKECIYPVEYDGKKACLEYAILQPAKFIADLGSFFVSAGAKMTAEAKLEKEDKSEGGPAANESVKKASGQSPDSGGGSSGGTDWKKVLNDICAVLPEQCAKVKGTIDNTINQATGGMTGSDMGGFTGGAEGLTDTLSAENISTQTIPDPIVVFAQDTKDLGNGIKQASIRWTSTSAISCIASNDWLTFGSESTPSIDSKFAVKNGEDLGAEGNMPITFPSLFSYTISTSGGVDPNAITLDVPPYSPQTITSKFSVDNSGNMIQTATYKPNFTNLKGWDYLILFLSDIYVSLNVGTDEDITTVSTSDLVNRIKQSIITKDDSPARFLVDTTTDSLIISQKTAAGTFVRGATYNITCYNEAGKEASKSIRLNFF